MSGALAILGPHREVGLQMENLNWDLKKMQNIRWRGMIRNETVLEKMGRRKLLKCIEERNSGYVIYYNIYDQHIR